MIIRAYNLKKGDLFIKQGVKYIIIGQAHGKFVAMHASTTATLKNIKHFDDKKILTIGLFSQERIELITVAGSKPVQTI